jgi:hypothetical protein
MATAIPAVPGFQFQLDSYAGKVRALSIVWFIYAGLSVLLGVMGLAFASAFMHGHFGQWAHGGWGDGSSRPEWLIPNILGPAVLRFAWLFVLLRSGLAIVAAVGLMERTEWGRMVAIVAAFLIVIKVPFGTALGIWTLITLLGYRNTTLYSQLQ